jgi:hypothetical protein
VDAVAGGKTASETVKITGQSPSAQQVSASVWNTTTNSWVRDPNILCDSGTGNIGWDMTDSENTGKTEAQLHARDKGAYSHPPQSGAHWKYSGVCYADAVLG